MVINLIIFLTLITLSKFQNISKAIKYLEDNIYPTSQGECGKFVGKALKIAGFKIKNENNSPYSFYYEKILVNSGFSIIGNERNIPDSFLPGDIMVNLNTTENRNGHICMFNGTRWLSDFAQKTMYTFNNDPNNPTFFFRETGNTKETIDKNENDKCQCYKNALKDDDNDIGDYCEEIIFEFLLMEICPLIPGIDGTEEEIDECEKNYFCGSSKNKSKYLKIPSIFILTFIFYICNNII